MSTGDINVETVEYKVVLIDPSLPKLFGIPTDGGYCLPRVRIPKWTRHAEEISDALRSKWQMNALVLTMQNRPDNTPRCAVAELLLSSAAETPPELVQTNMESLSDTEFDCGERATVHRILFDYASLGPFSRRGWLREAQAWIQKSVQDKRIEFSGNLRQFNAGETFALVRLHTTDGDSYWLKATGEPNRHECSLTVEISRLFPRYLPSLVAVREDWNAWVTKDAGKPLGSFQDLNILTAAATALADLQIESLDLIESLNEVGCPDRRLTRVRSRLPEIFTLLEEAMQNQTSTKVKPLTPSRLREIQGVVDQSCAHMEELGIPDCLVNGDINLDNILYDGERFRFVDWAEGGIGNPFLALQQVVQHVIREGEHLDWVAPICEAYKRKWLGLLGEQQIDGAFVLMPLITMVDYLYGRGDWFDSPRRRESSFQGFARTLGRCMDRATERLLSTEALQI